MRVLLALDGSPSAEAARALVAGFGWPAGSIVEVVGVLEPALDVVGFGIAVESAGNGTTEREQLEQTLDEAVASLDSPDLLARRRLIRGRAASAIVEAAEDGRAELLVIGNRGRGAVRAALLGSVSSAVVDHAPCPVLVARGSAVERVLLAVDGSVGARRALDFLAGTRLLGSRTVDVISVAPGPGAGGGLALDPLLGASYEAFEESLDAGRREAETVAAEAARTLSAAGCRTSWSLGRGDAAGQILLAARELRSDLIVMGSRGHTGLTRMLLGSVAHRVMLHAAASVLIVREGVRVRSELPAEDRGATYAPANAY